MSAVGPHANEPLKTSGALTDDATAALVLVHGRGGSAIDMLGLEAVVDTTRVALFAPQAAGNSWYPQSFLAPVSANEPGRSSGLSVLDSIVEDLADSGIPSERVILAGFSQGACLTLEFAARHPRRYGGVVGLTGGLIGEPGSLRGFGGSLDGTPVFLGSGDPDPHVPWSRVEETAAIFRDLNAGVEIQRYPGRPHMISRDELRKLQATVAAVLARGPSHQPPFDRS